MIIFPRANKLKVVLVMYAVQRGFINEFSQWGYQVGLVRAALHQRAVKICIKHGGQDGGNMAAV